MSAETINPSCRSLAVPIPAGWAASAPLHLPTVAPVPAPTVPIATAPSVAASAAA